MKTKLFIIFMFMGIAVWGQGTERWNFTYEFNSSAIDHESLSPELISLLSRDVVTISPIYDMEDIRNSIYEWLKTIPKTTYGAQVVNIWRIADVSTNKITMYVSFIDEWYNADLLLLVFYKK